MSKKAKSDAYDSYYGLDDLDAVSADEGGERRTEVVEGSKTRFFSQFGRKRSKKESVSGFWGDRFGGFGGWFGGSRRRSEDDVLLKRVDALTNVRRVGKIIFGQEAKFRYTAEKDAYGNLVSSSVQLDAEALQDTSMGWSDGKKVDAVMGNALSRAAVKRRYNPNGTILFFTGELQTARNLASAVKRDVQSLDPITGAFAAAARWIGGTAAVSEEFPGYAAYFDAEREFRHTNPKNKQAVEKAIFEAAAAGQNFAAATAAALWETLWPEEPLSGMLPDDVKELVSKVAADLREDAARADDNRAIMRAVEKALKPLAALEDSEPPPSQGDGEGEEGEGEGEGEGNGGEGGQEGDQEGQEGQQQKSAGQKKREDSHAAARAAERMREMLSLDQESTATAAGGAGVPEGDLHEADTYTELELKEETQGAIMREAQEFNGVSCKTVSQRPEPYTGYWSGNNGSEDAGRKAYKVARREVMPYVHRTKEALKFRNELATMDEYGLRRGLIDEGGIQKVAFGDPRIFRRQDVIASPSVHLGLLIDESGSMRSGGSEVARKAAILLTEATKGFRGVTTSVWGHVNGVASAPNGCTIYRYIERNAGDPETLGFISGRGGNADGFAVAYCGQRMLDLQREGENRILFVLADGFPAANIEDENGYESYDSGLYPGAYTGLQHTRDMVNKVRRSGTQVFMLGMGGHFNTTLATEMYGDGNFQLIRQIGDVPKSLAKLLEKALKQGSL